MVGAVPRQADPAAVQPERWWQAIIRMAGDLIQAAVALLVIALLLRPLLVLAVVLLGALAIWVVARLAYWLLSLIPMWFDPESPGRLHRWPWSVNLVICTAIGAVLLLCAQGLLVTGIGVAADWLNGKATDMPAASATVVSTVNWIGDLAWSSIGWVADRLGWCLAKLGWQGISATDLSGDIGAWCRGWVDRLWLALCRNPADAGGSASDPGLAGCRISGWDLTAWFAAMLLVLSLVVLFLQRIAEARRLRGLERQ
jgi:hypothetical protein